MERSITVFASSHVWIDHCSLSNCIDGLIDVVHGSTAITISNNYFTHHDKAILLGHSDSYTKDKDMQVTVAFNHFGEGLVQRMPRNKIVILDKRLQVANNDYTHWEVTKREHTAEKQWRHWNWRSEEGMMLNGAFFIESGKPSGSTTYARASSLTARRSSFVGTIIMSTGVLTKPAGVLDLNML